MFLVIYFIAVFIRAELSDSTVDADFEAEVEASWREGLRDWGRKEKEIECIVQYMKSKKAVEDLKYADVYIDRKEVEKKLERISDEAEDKCIDPRAFYLVCFVASCILISLSLVRACMCPFREGQCGEQSNEPRSFNTIPMETV